MSSLPTSFLPLTHTLARSATCLSVPVCLCLSMDGYTISHTHNPACLPTYPSIHPPSTIHGKASSNLNSIVCTFFLFSFLSLVHNLQRSGGGVQPLFLSWKEKKNPPPPPPPPPPPLQFASAPLFSFFFLSNICELPFVPGGFFFFLFSFLPFYYLT
ncbi:hypothetical protein L873DRAFT_1028240 [Choiromyces venosus 120613-1]|uniref:Uncharacterized protein n=1 Tax=Choiromyces venosus 120613-1 TaxID=1336337 RepID=A0A3N4JJQ9_9PEZI|nr:hypothetical protein L873DRAFT_1028240 [Choiromyces venosus 120613-1]